MLHLPQLIFGLAAAQVCLGLAIQHGTKINSSRQINVGLHVAVTHQRPGRQPQSQRASLGRERVRRHHAIQQTQAQRFRRIEGIGGEQKLLGLGRAGVTRQQPGDAEIAAESDLGVRSPELGLIGSNAQIAGQANSQARAHGESVDAGDGDLGHAVEPPGNLLSAAQPIDAFFERARRGVLLRHAADVAAGAEGPARASHNYHGHARIFFPAGQGFDGFRY
jgi:hypothetical protein